MLGRGLLGSGGWLWLVFDLEILFFLLDEFCDGEGEFFLGEVIVFLVFLGELVDLLGFGLLLLVLLVGGIVLGVWFVFFRFVLGDVFCWGVVFVFLMCFFGIIGGVGDLVLVGVDMVM